MQSSSKFYDHQGLGKSMIITRGNVNKNACLDENDNSLNQFIYN